MLLTAGYIIKSYYKVMPNTGLVFECLKKWSRESFTTQKHHANILLFPYFQYFFNIKFWNRILFKLGDVEILQILPLPNMYSNFGSCYHYKGC